MTRTPLVVGNWKMELSHKAATEALKALKKLLQPVTTNVDIVICPSFTTLPEAAQLLSSTKRIQLGAQNVHWEEKGAWTGQMSVTQLLPFVQWCIVGHSEVRALMHVTDQEVERQADILLTHGITPIICIGETKEERDADQTVTKITTQVQSLLGKLTRTAFAKLVIAYEPIWAIGTGDTPDPADVSGIMLLVRKQLAEKFGEDAAARVRLLYGGSVKPDNVALYVNEPGVDGVLVGGASVHPLQLLEIIKVVQAKAGV